MGRWTANPSWWEFVWINNNTENYFLSLVRSEGKNACLNLWPSFLSFEQSTQGTQGRHWGCLTSSTRQWILGTLSPSEVLAKLGDESLRYLRFNAATLPPAVRIALLDQLPDDAPEAYELLPMCEGLDSFALVRWLHGSTQHIAAERIWARPTDEISSLLGGIAGMSAEKVEALLTQCPDQQTEVALETMERNPGLVSQEYCKRWARQRMANARHCAQRLIALIQPISRIA